MNLITLGALTGLAVIVFLHIYYLQKQLQAAAQQGVGLLSSSNLSDQMDATVQTLRERLEEEPSSSPNGAKDETNLESQVAVGLAYGRTDLKRMGLEDLASLDDCGELTEYGPASVNFRCAALILQEGASRDSAYRAIVEARRVNVGQILADLYRENEASRQKKTLRILPPIPFVYAKISFGNSEAVIIYPGLLVGPKFDFRSRPWYRLSATVGEFDVSNLYHDYGTNDFVVSISKASELERPVRVYADYRVQASGTTGIDLFILNALIAIVALTTYTRFYARSHLIFQRYLVISTTLLVLTYITLIINQILSISNSSHIPSRSLIAALGFVPNGSFLIVSAFSLLGYRLRALWLFPIAYLAEASAAFFSNATGQLAFTAGLSCACLSFFGWSLLKAGEGYGRADPFSSGAHLRSSARYGFFAYVLWGVTQFWIILLGRESSYLWSFLAPLVARWAWMDLLFSDIGGFVLLLYAKGVAIFFTISFLYSLEISKLRERFDNREPLPSVHLDSSGVILSLNDLPSDFNPLIGRRFFELLGDAEDQSELSHAFANDLRIHSYLCRIPAYFGDSLLSLTLDTSDSRSSTRRVWLRRFDMSILHKKLDKKACERLLSAIEPLRNGINDTSSRLKRINGLEEAQTLLAGFDQSFLRVSAELLETSRRELMTLKEQKLVQHVKADLNQLWEIFCGEAIQFTQRSRRPGIGIQLPEPPPAGLPSRLRISTSIWQLVVVSVLTEIVHDHGGNDLEEEVKIVLSLSESNLLEKGVLMFQFKTRPCPRLRDAVSAMRRGRLFDSWNDREGDQPGANLFFSHALMKVFDGDLSGYERDDIMVLEVKVRALLSREGDQA